MNQYLLILFIFVLPIHVFSQERHGRMVGTVKDQQGNPLPYANVHLINTRYGCATDEKGGFSLAVPPATYELRISALGFTSRHLKVSLKAGEVMRIEIPPLEEDVSVLGQVVVRGKSAIQEVRETPFNVVALNAKSHYNSTMDLGHLLGKASGVKIRESGGVGSDMNISINGFTGRNIKIFMDGVPMQGNSSSFQLNNIPVSLAERIEVYKGVVPVEFGSDALGGVINIVTNRTTNTFVDASYSYGSFNTHRTNLILGHTTPRGFSFQLNAYQNYSDNDYRIKSRLITNGQYSRETLWFKRFHGGYHNEAVVARAGWVNKPWADRFFIGATLSRDHKEVQNAPANIEFVYGEVSTGKKGIQPNLEYYKRDLLVKGLTVRISGNYNYNINHNVDTSSYKYNWLGEHAMNVSKGERGTSALSDFYNSNYAGTANVSYRINEHHSVTVNDVQSGSVRKITSDAPPEQLSEYEKLRRISLKNVLGVSYRYRQSRSWNTDLFAKNYFQKVQGPYNEGDEGHPSWLERTASYNTIGYGAATTYFRKYFQYKASVERAYRLPSDNELFGDENEEQGNSSLKAENSMNYNLGVTMNKEFKNGHVLYVDVSGYFRNTKDFIKREIMVRTGTLTSVNFGRTQNLGVDIEAHYYFKNRAMIGGTFAMMNLQNKEKYRDSQGAVISAVYGDHMPNIPFRFGRMDAAYYVHNLLGKGNVLNLNYGINYVGEFFLNWQSMGNADGKYTLPTQYSHDFSATYIIKDGRYNISFEAGNLTNAELSDNFGQLKPGRAFYGKLRYYFMKRSKNSK